MKLGFFRVNFSEKSLEEVVRLVSQIMEKEKIKHGTERLIRIAQL